MSKYWWLGVLIILIILPSVWAGEIKDQEQTSGGETYYFYYADKNNPSDHHLFASQTFMVKKVGTITQIHLNLKRVASVWNPCWYDNEIYNVELRNKYDDPIASKNNLAICDLSTSFSWKEIKFTSPAEVDPTGEYKIVVLYKGNALKESPNFAWDRSTSNVIDEGSSTDGNFVESPKDFTFKIYGEEAQLCTADWKCQDSTHKGYQKSDCTWTSVTYCGDNGYCQNGECYDKTNVNIDYLKIFKNSVEADSFTLDDPIKFYAKVSNKGVAGKFNLYFDIYDSQNQKIDYTSFTDKDIGEKGYAGDSTTLSYQTELKPDWGWKAGQYHFSANTEPCFAPNACSSGPVYFNVNTPCIDNDKDSYGTGCTNGADCDDNIFAVHSTQSCTNYNTCGTEQLCVAQCSAKPPEILCDGKNNDCDANTKDDNCGAGKTCDLGMKQCVNTICVSGTQNCDGNWVNGCEVNINSDTNNCGGCGKKCGINEECSSGTCTGIIQSTNPNNWVLIQDQLFYNEILPELVKNKNANKYFFNGEKEEVVENLLDKFKQDPMGNAKDLSKLKTLVVMREEKFLETLPLIKIPLQKTFFSGNEMYIIKYKATIVDDALALKSIQYAEEMKKFATPTFSIAGNKIPLIDLGFSVLTSVEQSEGNPVAFLFYTTSNLAYNLNPVIVIANWANFGKKGIFFVSGIICDTINYKECEIPLVSDYIINPISEVLDYFTDPNIIKKTIGNAYEAWDGIQFWTHPLPNTEEIKIVEQNSEKVVFKVKVKNLFGATMENSVGGIFKDMQVSAKVDGSEYSCDLKPTKITINPTESAEVFFEWKIPANIPKNKLLKFKTVNWYSCSNKACIINELGIGCKQPIDPATQCVIPDTIKCEANGWAGGLSGGSLEFTTPNQPPIINSVTCNSLNLLGVPCPKDINIYAGDKLTMILTTHDLDDNSLEINYAGDYPAGSTKFCKDIDTNPYGEECTFTFQFKPEDMEKSGLKVNLIVSDGIDQVIESFNFKVLENSPQLIYPVDGDTTNTQNPTFKWGGIASAQPVNYTINLYTDPSQSPKHTILFPDPNPANPNKEHKLIKYTLDKHKYYWWEVVGINNYKIELKSKTKNKFWVDCAVDTDCGQSFSNGLSCGNDGVYEEIITPKCVEPETTSSQCIFESKKVQNQSCLFGCSSNTCITPAQDDDTDKDGILTVTDNCPLESNSNQEDTDKDGLGNVCDEDDDGDGFADSQDCSPLNPLFPTVEVCDGKDNDCDGKADNGLNFFNIYPDQDGDNYGDGASLPTSVCKMPESGSWVANNEDCWDKDKAYHQLLTCSYTPVTGCGKPSVCALSCPTPPQETCNNKDDDCDGIADNGFNLQSDIQNCGSCGNKCSTNQICTSGKCVSTEKPNLKITSLKLLKVKPVSKTQCRAYFEVKAANNGTAQADSFSWQVTTSNNNVLKEGSYSQKVLPGQSKTLLFSFPFSGSIQPLFTLDYQNQLVESNEKDNSQAYPTKLSCPPPQKSQYVLKKK